ncbi:uncharacterized protein LOC107267581 isoform X2 [Cephus cinctus]|uniref:Phosphodiesterase n=1 Tax=Cephus cinctus TaxID=211228 RepID=A0AAJ7W1M3_CEPCN|nr:uncharacterized protein LOC107267581 isoform X2 [Cephus cinctus]
MIPYSTCLCFGGRRDARRWVLLHDELCPFPKRAAAITVDSAEQNAVFVRISEEAALASAGSTPTTFTGTFTTATTPTSRRLSNADRLLLENLDVSYCRPRHVGRFLTMHKRRRKRLITRSLSQDSGMLDDIFHGQVRCVLQRAGNWRFNAFTLETVTGGRSLPVLCVHLFHWYGLLQHFNLEVVRVWKLFALIEEGYHSTNPYHNSIHATDVTQAMHCFLQEEKIKAYLSPLEVMASLIAAVTHDLDHPGVNQPFLVATSNHLAALYENTSVLENHHWRSAIGCLLESGVSEQLTREVRSQLQEHISSLILATDITRQQEFLTRFKQYLDENLLDMRRPEDRHFVLQIALKCADISNPCRPWDISRKWSHKVCEEFFRQGDYERQLNLPVTPLCNRYTTSIPKIQVGFFKFVVAPLYEEWHRFLSDGLSVSLMKYLRENQDRWETMIIQDNVEETKIEMSNLEEIDNVEISSGDEIVVDDSGSIDLLLPDLCTPRRPSFPGKINTEHVGRRHSVPLSVSKPLSLPRTDIRRESLPAEHKKSKPSSLAKLEDQSLLPRNSLSSLSSRSSVHESLTAESPGGRPVSAENLLPEPSIASITNSVEASRLSTVLQPDQKASSQTKQLTRQQTFPPLQPYVRTRYMSTTAEMSQCCSDTFGRRNENSGSKSTLVNQKSCFGGKCGTPPESPPRKISSDLSAKSNFSCIGRSFTEQHAKRRGSAVSDHVKRSTDLITCSEYPRRHSMQISDPMQMNLGAKQHAHSHRQRRPSSGQEIDSTQRFYAFLTGSARTRHETPPSETPPTSFSSSYTAPDAKPYDDIVRELSEEYLQADVPECRLYPGAQPESLESRKCQPSGRRCSIPISNSKSTENLTSRRFSALPVLQTSEPEGHRKVFFIGSPPDSPPMEPSASSSNSGSELQRGIGQSCTENNIVSGKRDSETMRDKGIKIPKLSVESEMKENVDPRVADDGSKLPSLTRRCGQGWARRRGSAPVGLMSRLEDISTSFTTSRVDRYSRRGSVPTDITAHQNGGPNRSALGPCGENLPLPRRASLPQERALGNFFSSSVERENCPMNNNNNAANGSGSSSANNNNNRSSSDNNGTVLASEGATRASGMPSPRRGSVPADISELRRDLFNRNSGNVNGNGNGKSRRKKILRRRSSGGPEMFAGRPADGNDNGTWLHCKRDLLKNDSIPEPAVKRRGSLPIEMVAAVSHAGSTTGTRRSSLWRL